MWVSGAASQKVFHCQTVFRPYSCITSADESNAVLVRYRCFALRFS